MSAKVYPNCDDCGVSHKWEPLKLVAADLGRGAFLAILCADCWHRRQYRAELRRRQQEKRQQNPTTP